MEDALHLLRTADGELEWLVVDIEDAFHNIPLAESEQPFAAAMLDGKVVVFKVLCMGGKAAPGVWGRFAACAGRVVASTLASHNFRMEIYVDDPLCAACGSHEVRNRLFTKALLLLCAMGFPLAWSKASIGASIVWIGAELSHTDASVTVAAPETKLQELGDKTASLRKERAIISSRHLRSFCGLVSFFAGMVPIMRPFLAMLWAALAAKSRLKRAVICKKQVCIALDWLAALARIRPQGLSRTFPTHVVVAPEGDYFATDACPWGMGGVLFKNHVPVAWWASPITTLDLQRFRAKRGDSAHNTTWEALAILVSARIWQPALHQKV